MVGVLVPGGIRHARVSTLAPPNIAPAQPIIPVTMLSELYVENRKWKEVFLYPWLLLSGMAVVQQLKFILICAHTGSYRNFFEGGFDDSKSSE
jgi:hypothetical protein